MVQAFYVPRATYLSLCASRLVFALPFALTGALLAARTHPVTWRHVGWIVVAMVAARSAAMGFNRLVDARHDALNPRTAMRELPRGVMSRTEATVFVVLSSLVFVSASWRCTLCAVFRRSRSRSCSCIARQRYTVYTPAFLGLAKACAVGGWLPPVVARMVAVAAGAAIGLWVGASTL